MQFDTVFRSGSMGKVYTGIAAMQLIERGQFALDDAIEEFLPFPVVNPLGRGPITIRHLMTHSSGLGGDAAGCVFSAPASLSATLAEIYARDEQPLWGGLPTWTYATGTDRMYSNIGIATLGLIVERSNPGGLSYSEFVEQNIMQPLQMTSTQYPPVQDNEHVRPDVWERRSKGYNSVGGVAIESPDVYIETIPAGAFVSIPRDHVRLFSALMNGGELDGARILSASSVDQMLSASGPASHPGYADSQHGLVWFLKDWAVEGQRAFFHGGGHMYGWRTMGIAWPDHDTAVVYAINEWATTPEKDYYSLINGCVASILASEPPANRVASQPHVEDLAWKASYLRGLLFVESYRFGIGVRETVDLDFAIAAASDVTRSTLSSSVLPWDEDGFLQGVNDMNAVEPNVNAIQRFASDSTMKISLDEARQLAARFGSVGGYASLGGLLV